MYYIAIDKTNNITLRYGENYILTKEELINLANRGKFVLADYIIYKLNEISEVQFILELEEV